MTCGPRMRISPTSPCGSTRVPVSTSTISHSVSGMGIPTVPGRGEALSLGPEFLVTEPDARKTQRGQIRVCGGGLLEQAKERRLAILNRGRDVRRIVVQPWTALDGRGHARIELDLR